MDLYNIPPGFHNNVPFINYPYEAITNIGNQIMFNNNFDNFQINMNQLVKEHLLNLIIYKNFKCRKFFINYFLIKI